MSFRRGRNGFSEMDPKMDSDLESDRRLRGFGSNSEMGMRLTMEWWAEDLGEENDVAVAEVRW